MGVSLQDAQAIFTDTGLRTQYGVILPPGSRVAAYVRSIGQQSGDDAFLTTNLVPTLAQGLARVRAGLGDAVVVLPGHTENVADATTISNALVAGAKIVGVGLGGNTPTFTFTATTSQIAVSVNDVLIVGCRFLLDGINAVANAFNITGADFNFLYNEVRNSQAAKACTVCMTLAAGADRANVTANVFRGLSTSTGTDGILVSGAINDARICDNEMVMATTTTNGLVRVTAAALGLKILRNTISNTIAASVAGINLGNVAITGQVANNTITVLNTGAQVSGTTGITIGAACVAGFFQNFVVNDPLKSGILQPAADT